MNAVFTEVYVYSPTHELLTVIPEGAFSSLTYGLKDSEPGVLELILPLGFDISYLKIDGQLEVYVFFGNHVNLEGDTAWFIRRPVIYGDSIKVTAYSACSLLGRRIVAYYAGSSYTDKVGIPWDNLLKEFVRENFGPEATDPDRDLSPWFTVPDNINYGLTHHKSAAWRNVLATLQEIVDDVRNSGIMCSIDVVRSGATAFEFRVFIGPRGTDHSASSSSPILISKETKTLAENIIDENWEKESNFIYATGQGMESERLVETASDSARMSISPFNRQEYNRQARQSKTNTSILAEATAALEERRPVRIFSGTIIETEGCRYNVHWNWGDIITAESNGLSFDCYVDSVIVTISEGGTRKVEGNLRSITDVDR